LNHSNRRWLSKCDESCRKSQQRTFLLLENSFEDHADSVFFCLKETVRKMERHMGKSKSVCFKRKKEVKEKKEQKDEIVCLK
jgi:hypothetical protein